MHKHLHTRGSTGALGLELVQLLFNIRSLFISVYIILTLPSVVIKQLVFEPLIALFLYILPGTR